MDEELKHILDRSDERYNAIMAHRKAEHEARMADIDKRIRMRNRFAAFITIMLFAALIAFLLMSF